MEEIDLRKETVFFNVLKRIYVAAKRIKESSGDILGVPAIKSADNKWFTVGSRLTLYRLQDLLPVDPDSPDDFCGESGQIGSAA